MNRKRPYPNLKTWRDDQRVGQRAAAALLGVSQSYYSKIERQTQTPNARLAKAITDKTGVPLETLLGIA